MKLVLFCREVNETHDVINNLDDGSARISDVCVEPISLKELVCSRFNHENLQQLFLSQGAKCASEPTKDLPSKSLLLR